MKPIVAGALGVLMIGLLFTGPVAFALIVMVLPLVGLALLSGAGLVRGPGTASRPRRRPVERGRHVVIPDHRR
jgi:hypothetical protein